MLEHHIQKSIVFALALTDSLRFSDLKPDDIENKLFDYHLKKVVASGLVTKAANGEYALTPLGRRIGKDALKKGDQLFDRAYAVLFMAVRRADGAWLLCKRGAHPLLHRTGFLHAQPNANQAATQVARNELLIKTGLHGTFTVRGSGYLRMQNDGNLESFTNFTLLACNDAHGKLEQLDPLAEYYYDDQPNFNDPLMLPQIATMVDLLAKPDLFYIEQTYELSGN